MKVEQCIKYVLKNYANKTQERFSGNAMAKFIRTDFPSTLEELSDDRSRYIFEGSPGKGNWTRSPWVAIFDMLITDTAQSGYYPVYLFREDFSGLYLSLNQGVTEIRQKYRSKAKNSLKTRAADYRAQLGGLPERFPLAEIDLRPSKSSNLSSFYEAGNICAQFYDFAHVPSEDQLVVDFRNILNIYEMLSYNETVPVGSMGAEEDEEGGSKFIEDLRKLRQHKRVERNSRLAKEVKRVHGYNCQVCNFNFEKLYGRIGNQFIEAHHLIPISDLKGRKLRLDPKTDFAVLCSNCHRMVHRFKHPHDLSAFRRVVLS